MQRVTWLLLVLSLMCSLWAHGQISQSEQTALLGSLQSAKSERMLIEQRLLSIGVELESLKRTNLQLSNEHELQKSLWEEQRESSLTRIAQLEEEKARLETLLEEQSDWEQSWTSLNNEFELYQSEAQKQRRRAFLKGAAGGAIVVAVVRGIVRLITGR